MIIWISGLYCTGKSTIVKNIVESQNKNFGDITIKEGTLVEPTKNFECIQFKDFMVIGARYYSNATNSGTDLIFAGNDRFKEFIIQEYDNHKNLLIEGSKFFRKDILDWLISKYKLKIFHLETDISIMEERSKNRNNYAKKVGKTGSTDKITNYAIKVYDEILNDSILKKYITICKNETMEDSKSITKNILKILLDKTC